MSAAAQTPAVVGANWETLSPGRTMIHVMHHDSYRLLPPPFLIVLLLPMIKRLCISIQPHSTVTTSLNAPNVSEL